MVENSEDGPRICYQQGQISGSRIFATKHHHSVTGLTSLLNFGPQGSTEISYIELSTGRNSSGNSTMLNFLLVEFEILPDWNFYHDIYKHYLFYLACFSRL